MKKQSPPKKPPNRKNGTAFSQLIELAYTLAQYTENMDLGGYEQRAQANVILAEVEKTMAIRNEWLVWQIIEASLIPKMTRLAKDINRYQNLIKSPGECRVDFRRKRTNYRKTHQSSAYDDFKYPPPKKELSEQERNDALSMLKALQNQLNNTEKPPESE